MNKQIIPEVIFLRVTDSNTKIGRIISTIQQHFLCSDPIIIFVPSKQAATYINTLLWKDPIDSFLPHAVVHESCHDKIAITELGTNLNGAKIALNLRPELCCVYESFEKIYELWDESDAQKMQQSCNKAEQYQKLEFDKKIVCSFPNKQHAVTN